MVCFLPWNSGRSLCFKRLRKTHGAWVSKKPDIFAKMWTTPEFWLPEHKLLKNATGQRHLMGVHIQYVLTTKVNGFSLFHFIIQKNIIDISNMPGSECCCSCWVEWAYLLEFLIYYFFFTESSCPQQLELTVMKRVFAGHKTHSLLYKKKQTGSGELGGITWKIPFS